MSSMTRQIRGDSGFELSYLWLQSLNPEKTGSKKENHVPMAVTAPNVQNNVPVAEQQVLSEVNQAF
jgi:hypothetical protein